VLPNAVLPDNGLRPEELPARLLQVLLLTSGGRVLFVCVENAGRSLIAEAIFNADPPDGWSADSAGTRPARAANLRTGPMLAEIGVELPEHPPRELTLELIDSAAIRITMGCLDDSSCPAYLKMKELRDWALPDPARLDDPGFRGVRDEIARRVAVLRSEIRKKAAEDSGSKPGATR
jgi:arsenate reductase (thioredoxin)